MSDFRSAVFACALFMLAALVIAAPGKLGALFTIARHTLGLH